MMSKVAVVLATLGSTSGARINRKHPGASSTCGVKGASAPSSQIVNGQPATDCEWRWQARLEYKGMPFCGGTLVAPQWVLTAAHCVNSPDFAVILGGYNSSKVTSRQQSRDSVEVWLHPDYKSSPTRNDFAMVKLASPVTFDDCVGPVCLPTPGSDATPGQKCWITGWGRLRTGGANPEVLQEASVRIVSNEDLVNVYNYSSMQIDDTMIGAQGKLDNGKITDGCQGDSGGPLVCEGDDGKWAIYGATSWGMGCADKDFPGIWARVHKEVQWVQDVVSGAYTTPPPTPAPPRRRGSAWPTWAPTPAPPPCAQCPEEFSTGPDGSCDCSCKSGLTCYESGRKGCTYSVTLTWGGKSDQFFLGTCSDCKCE